MSRWLDGGGRFVALFLLIALGLPTGCGAPSEHARQTPEPPVARAPIPRLDVAPGMPLVIVLPRDAAPLTEPIEARLSDGVRLPAEVYRVRVTLPAASASADNAGWLPPAGQWRAIPPARGVVGGTQVVVVDVSDAPDAGDLSINQRRYRLNWLPRERELPPTNTPPSEPVLNAWRPVAEAALLTDPALQGRVKSEAASPITRWRYRLLMDGLIPSDPPSEVNAFEDPIIEAIARQNEARWRVALAWTWRANPELAWRLKQSLARVVDFGGRVYAPAWSVDHAALDRLLADLLDPVLTPARRGELAEAWLLAQPAGVAWVIDDGGLLDDSRRQFISSIGLANLTDHATQVWIDTPDHAGGEFRPVLSLSTVKVLVPIPATQGQISTPITPHIGQWSGVVNVQSTRIPAVPPGFIIGPLLNDYTLEHWSGIPSTANDGLPASEWRTAALLRRRSRDATEMTPSSDDRKWEVLVECRLPVGITSPEALNRECVRLCFGSAERRAGVLRVDMTGEVTVEGSTNPILPEELQPRPGHTEVIRAADRWSFRVPIPPWAFEGDGTVRLGVTRTDAVGRRSAWPRAMMPWQEAVGKAAVDTQAWTGADAP